MPRDRRRAHDALSIDWILVVVPIALVAFVSFAVYTRRFVKSVADFLSGGRCAGRYLLANARGEVRLRAGQHDVASSR